MSGLPAEYFRFGLYAIVGLIVSFVAEGMGLAIGATFSITVSLKINTNIFFRTNVQTTFLVACIFTCIATLSFVTFIFISEWKRCWTIADCTVTRFGHLWFRLCSRHSNGYVCNYESVVCSSWCCFIGVVSLWI